MADLTLIDEFVRYQVERRGLTGRYGYQSKQKLLSLAEWLGLQAEWGDLDEVLLERWAWRERRTGQVGAAATVEKDLIVVRGFYQWLQRRGHVLVDPTVEVPRPKVHNKHPKPIRDEVWIDWYANTQWIDADAIVFMGLCYLVGLRLHEALLVRGEQVLPSGQIVGLKRKGGSDDTLDVVTLVQVVARGLPHLLPDQGDRFLTLYHERAKRSALLLDWTASRTDRRSHQLAPEENDPQWVYKRIRKWARDARPSPSGLWTPHRLRHSFATNLLRCDMPIHMVSRYCNHSSPTVTMRYAKIGGSELRKFAEQQAHRVPWQVNRFA